VNVLARSFLVAIFLTLIAGCASGLRAIVWDPLPFPKDSDWAGPKGATAMLAGKELVLQGQDVRTRSLYQAPLTIECDVELEARTASDGAFAIKFVASGEPHQMVAFRMIYRNPGAYSGKDGLAIERRSGSLQADVPGDEEPFDLKPAVPYHVKVEMLADRLRVTINKRPYEAAGVSVPKQDFYVQLGGWQPANRWHVRNLVVH
jgi:hypothetical protein